MASKINLATITASIDEEYGSTFVELSDGNEVELLNPIRLSPDARKAMRDLSDGGDTDEAELTDEQKSELQEEQIERLTNILRIVAATPDQAEALIKACSPRGYVDVAIIGAVVGDYMEAESAGEASASQD